MCDEEGLPFTISGAGSTLLIISKDDDIIKKLIKVVFSYNEILNNFNFELISLVRFSLVKVFLLVTK